MAPNNYQRPLSDTEWEEAKPHFERLYIGEARPLPKVMELMEKHHGFKASQKMYKNRIKQWGLSKYLKSEQAERLANEGGASDEMTQKGIRSMARRRNREQMKQKSQHGRHASTASNESPPRQMQQVQQPLPAHPSAHVPAPVRTTLTVTPAQHQPHPQLQTYTSQSPIASAAFVAEPSPIQQDNPAPWTAPQSFKRGSTSSIEDQFLVNLRAWTHEAFVTRQWERSASVMHQKGRHASRQLASELGAGIKLLEQNSELAWAHWGRAVEHFQNPELFKTWYHETPVRLLFEVSRIAHLGHPAFAVKLLSFISEWAASHLDKSDVRHALYGLYNQIPPTQLKPLYVRAARCMLDGLKSRLEPHNPLLVEVRLNRALDMVWFEPMTDLSEWVLPLDQVDRACGSDNQFSIYYLLLEAYQLVGRDKHEEAERVTQQAQVRIEALQALQEASPSPDPSTNPNKNLDEYRVAMAYRRLGRMQYTKGRFQDARRSFNTALRYVGVGVKAADNIMVEVFQCQESMARALKDEEDAQLWSRLLKAHEMRVKEKQEADLAKEAAAITNGMTGGTAQLSPMAIDGGMATPGARSASPRPLSRSTTF